MFVCLFFFFVNFETFHYKRHDDDDDEKNPLKHYNIRIYSSLQRVPAYRNLTFKIIADTPTLKHIQHVYSE